MLYVFHGPDYFRAHEDLRALRDRLDKDGNLVHNTITMDRSEVRSLTAGALRAACQTPSFFAEDRLVILSGLQDRFSGQRRRGARRAQMAEAGTSELTQFVDVLTDLPESTTVVLLDEQSAAALMESIQGKAEVKRFDALKGAELRAWAAQRVKEARAEISAEALNRLLLMVDGNHIGVLAQEIDKLATYTRGERIELQDVEAVASSAVDYQMWDLTDAIIAGRAERALAVAQGMDRTRQAPQLLLFMITRQYRQLMLVQALLRDGLASAQIGAQLGINPGYPLQKLTEQATRYPAERLEAAYRRLLETDVAVKTGVIDVDTALDVLIVELAELGRAPRRTAGR